ncbi:TldD/PmbA family protein ['Crotalaria aegyptiaca' phytoplasma]|uniref:TldD/PmbA family protein n=1 Tax=Candidatus Phytoplasma crotalariae TaxID=2982627 RepID=A0ABT9D2L7_9MOLU|nr:metallopeptidase TldD-related protein ['Crotalaria aegyptiaca' phytoplasma]MDO8059256.1 TldD/PmbA family protein ['Crotalaria aegyptiaca' phytoplasma]
MEKIDDLNDDVVIDKILKRLKEKIRILNFNEQDFLFSGSPQYNNIIEDNFNFDSIPCDHKIKLLRKFYQQLLVSQYFTKKCNLLYSEIFWCQKIVNSLGLKLQQCNSYALLEANCVFGNNQIQEEEVDKSFPVKKFEDFKLSMYVKNILTLGESKIGAKTLPSKFYRVIFSNEVFSELLSNFQNVFNALYVYRNLSKYQHSQGKLVANPKVTIIDDPFISTAFFNPIFDDEGVACRAKPIITKGILNNFIHNLQTAKIFNVLPEGNSFNGSISMSNCYLKSGNKSLPELLYAVKNGIYVNSIVGCHAGIDEISGSFSLQASGFCIKNGFIKNPFNMVVVSGNFFDLLNNIQDIANDFKFQISGFGSSSVYVGLLNISGS